MYLIVSYCRFSCIVALHSWALFRGGAGYLCFINIVLISSWLLLYKLPYMIQTYLPLSYFIVSYNLYN